MRAPEVAVEWLQTLALALAAFIAMQFLMQNVRIAGSSMEPTLQDGQYVLVNRLAYIRLDLPLPLKSISDEIAAATPRPGASGGASGSIAGPPQAGLHPFGSPERGDVVVFRYPLEPSRDFIKRIVALPGETIEIRGGRVLVDGRSVPEPYPLDPGTYDWPVTVVPPGHYFVLGDNRDNSSDSHIWGPVPFDNIVGKAWVAYRPGGLLGALPVPHGLGG